MRRISQYVLIGLFAGSATACLHGPRAFQRSHALHNEALRARIDEELLLNLVRLRYRDSPLFLQVGSIVTQFEVTGALGVSGSRPDGGTGVLGLEAGVGWSEQPTYTFTPLHDDEFVRRLLTPIDLELIVLLQRSGWSIDRVLRLTVQSLGKQDNATSASGPTPERTPDFADFQRVTRSLRRLQQQGLIQIAYQEQRDELSSAVGSSSVAGADLVRAAQSGMRFDSAPDATGALVLTQAKQKVVLLVAPAARDREELEEFTRLLDLPPGREQYEIVTSAWPGRSQGGETIGVSTRSLLGAFFYVSQGIEVPAAHAEKGLVTITRDADGQLFDWRQMTGDILRVRQSKEPPASAAVAVPYRNHWFFIEDADLESKSTFALLHELFNMSAKASSGAAPTLTLPIGG